jgi:hypothetical protein
MKKQITMILEVDSDDETMISDKFIQNDIMAEIGCASNTYELVSFKSETINE